MTTHDAAPARTVGWMDDARLLSEWFAVGWSCEVIPGGLLTRRILGRELVLWRSAEGQLQCWLDLCIHRGARLSLGTLQKQDGGDCLVCPYHGWRYAASGQCVAIPAHPEMTPPAKARAKVFQVSERFGVIWVCFGQAAGPMPEFPDCGRCGISGAAGWAVPVSGFGPRLIENFLDVAHLGIVHAGLLGDPGRSDIQDYEVAMGSRGPEAREIRVWQPNPDGTGAGGYVSYHYEVLGPLTASFLKLPGRRRGRSAFRDSGSGGAGGCGVQRDAHGHCDELRT